MKQGFFAPAVFCIECKTEIKNMRARIRFRFDDARDATSAQVKIIFQKCRANGFAPA
jgi:hypothetical protein